MRRKWIENNIWKKNSDPYGAYVFAKYIDFLIYVCIWTELYKWHPLIFWSVFTCLDPFMGLKKDFDP